MKIGFEFGFLNPDIISNLKIMHLSDRLVNFVSKQ